MSEGDTNGVRVRVAVLESKQANLEADVAKVEDSCASLAKELTALRTQLTELVSAAKAVRFLIGVSIPLIPVIAAAAHKAIDTFVQ